MKKIKGISGLLAKEIKDTMFLKEFSFSDKIIKLAVVPFDYHGPEGHEIRQWPKDVLVCSIKWNTKLSTLVENRGTDGYVTLDIKANKDQYISQF